MDDHFWEKGYPFLGILLQIYVPIFQNFLSRFSGLRASNRQNMAKSHCHWLCQLLQISAKYCWFIFVPLLMYFSSLKIEAHTCAILKWLPSVFFFIQIAFQMMLNGMYNYIAYIFQVKTYFQQFQASQTSKWPVICQWMQCLQTQEISKNTWKLSTMAYLVQTSPRCVFFAEIWFPVATWKKSKEACSCLHTFNDRCW